MAELHLQRLSIHTTRGICLVRDVDLQVTPGELLGVVGASGSGKSLTLRSLLGLVDEALRVQARLEVSSSAGVVHPYQGDRRARAAAFAPLRGAVLALMPQNAEQSLDPFRTVGEQLRRVYGGPHSLTAVQGALQQAGFEDVREVVPRYPHELSSGMARRVALASVLLTGATYLLCDEPTTGLDTTAQRALMQTLRSLVTKDRAVVVVSHALRWLRSGADRVVVFDAGQVVERVSRGEPFVSAAGRALVAAMESTASPGFPSPSSSPGSPT